MSDHDVSPASSPGRERRAEDHGIGRDDAAASSAATISPLLFAAGPPDGIADAGLRQERVVRAGMTVGNRLVQTALRANAGTPRSVQRQRRGGLGALGLPDPAPSPLGPALPGFGSGLLAPPVGAPGDRLVGTATPAAGPHGPVSLPPPPPVPGQLSDPSRAQQVTTPFGAYTVYPDTGQAMTPAARNAIGQRELVDLREAWSRIEQSLGPFINGQGANAAENRSLAERFRQILTEEMPESPYLRRLIVRITQDRAHPFAVNVVRGRADVYVDSYDSRAVDLADLEQFGPRGVPRRTANEMTRGELLAHFLGERYHDVTHPPPSGTDGYAPAHAQGIVEQNRYRAERGQVEVVSSDGMPVPGTGLQRWIVRFRDGSRQEVDFAAGGQIVRNDLFDRAGRLVAGGGAAGAGATATVSPGAGHSP